jgi:hypothetical protein
MVTNRKVFSVIQSVAAIQAAFRTTAEAAEVGAGRGPMGSLTDVPGRRHSCLPPPFDTATQSKAGIETNPPRTSVSFRSPATARREAVSKPSGTPARVAKALMPTPALNTAPQSQAGIETNLDTNLGVIPRPRDRSAGKL